MTSETHKQPVRVSRKDLYERVWQTPITRLAADYSVSGNGLAKICDRLKIPYPPRGYWAKKAASKKVIEYQLPESDSDTPLEVTINPTPAPVPAPELPTKLQATLAAARNDASTISVSSKLVRPHRVIAEWLTEHARKAAEAKREHDPWRRQMMQPAKFSLVDRRMHRILDALFKAIESRGLKVKVDERRAVYIEAQNERIDYDFREKQKQVRRPLTDEERRWGFNPDRPWRQELKPRGFLQFSIKTHLANGMPHEWIDKSDKPIEAYLSEIVAILSLAGPILTDKRREREAAEQLRREAEHKRYLEQQRQQLDHNRWRRFLELYKQQWLRLLDVAADIRAFIAANEAQLKTKD